MPFYGFSGIPNFADELQEGAARASFLVKPTSTLLVFSGKGLEVMASMNVNWHLPTLLNNNEVEMIKAAE